MSASGAVGRLEAGPHPVLFKILYEPALKHDLEAVLPHLLAIDAAHVVMATERRLLRPEIGAQLLVVNRELTQLVARGERPLAVPETHRGLYFLYENEYIRRLGPEVGGSAHVARSRNDINATIFRLRAREELVAVLGLLEACSEALETQALGNLDTVVSGFTHFQPAQPTTLGHMLAGVLGELDRGGAWLAQSWDMLNQSPMGAAAGFGTAFPIDRARVADLLGFDGVVGNSLDAVGSRDSAVHLLAPLAMLGTTFSRWALELQQWSSTAYGFIEFPDALVSTSSIMPQKRNAFVLENIRGAAVKATGALMSTLMGLKNTPFTNSVEVSGEATTHLWPALAATRNMVELSTLLASSFTVSRPRARAFLAGKDTTMTALADALVANQGLSFRMAHEAVATLVARAAEGGVGPQDVRERLPKLLPTPPTAQELEALVASLDPAGSVAGAGAGGGPAPVSVRHQLAVLAARRNERKRVWSDRRTRLTEAAARRSSAVTATIEAASASRKEEAR